MKFVQIQIMAILFTIGFVASGLTQDFPDVEQVGDQQCAVAGSDLHVDLDVRGEIPNCARYCTVDKETLPEYRDFPGLVFACAQFGPGPTTAALLDNAGAQGLLAGSNGALASVALLLGLLAAGGGGSTSGTN